MNRKTVRQLQLVGLLISSTLGLLLFFFAIQPQPVMAGPQPLSVSYYPSLLAQSLTITSPTGCTITQITNTTGEINDQPVLSANGSYIAFWSTADLLQNGSNADHNTEIFRADVSVPSSPSFIQVSNTQGNIIGGFNLSPAISGNGQRIAFFSDDITAENKTGNFELFLAAITGSPVVLSQVTNTENGFSITPVLSSDGTRLVFSSDESHDSNGDNTDRNTEIFMAEVDGFPIFTQITQSDATISGGFNQAPVLSGDGSHIAFVSDRNLSGLNSDESNEIFLYDLNAPASFQALTQNLDSRNPTIDQDGSHVAFTVEKGDASEIWLYRSEPALIRITAGNSYNKQPALSPDGRFVAFVSDRTGKSEIFLTSTSGSRFPAWQLTQATNGSDHPSISSIGSDQVLIAFTADAGQNSRDIYLADCGVVDLVISKRADQTEAIAGEKLTYSITVTNTDSVEAIGVTVTDLFPAEEVEKITSASPTSGGCDTENDSDPRQVTCYLGTLSPGATATVTIEVKVNGDAVDTVVNDQATVSSTGIDPDGSNNVAPPITTTVTRLTNLFVEKDTSRDPAISGLPLTYFLTVGNSGPSTARNVVVTDTLPAHVSYVSDNSGCDFVDNSQVVCQLDKIKGNRSKTVEIKVNVSGSFTGTLTNTAIVTDEDGSSDSVQEMTEVEYSADLGVDKDGLSQIYAGNKLEYTVTVTNHGPAPAENVSMTDLLEPVGGNPLLFELPLLKWNIRPPSDGTCDPSSTSSSTSVKCSLGRLEPGEIVIIEIATPEDIPIGGFSVQNTASVSSDTYDYDGTNNSDVVITSVE